MHNELSPSIPRKNWLPLPFGGPHCLWASPLVLQTQMQRKNVKKSVEKKIKCIFWSSSWIRTCGPIKVGDLADRSLSYRGHAQWAKSFHTRGKIGFPSLLGVHMVCEHPLWYYKRKCKEKMWKSLLRKKLNAFFGAAPGFEPATL